MSMFKDTQSLINKFIGNDDDKQSDYLKRENSNFVYSLPLLRKNIANMAEEDFLMNNILPKKLVDLYNEGVIYIHDKQLSSYCQSISCKDLAEHGIRSLAKNMNESKPASSLPTLIRHFSNIIVLMSQQVSGAVMLSQMTTILASYLYYEEKFTKKRYTKKTLTKLLYQLIFELNLPLRSGSESAFSNCTLEFGKPSEEIKDDLVIIGGEMKDFTYAEIPARYYNRINKAFIDAMAKGAGQIPFTFPLITVQIDDNFNYDNPQFLYLMEKMYNWGGVYFENFRTDAFEPSYYTEVNTAIKAKDPAVSRSLCCRLNIDLSTLSRAGGGIFGSSVGNVGAIQVLNLNMNRTLMEFGHDETLLYAKIREYMEIMQEGHMAKRKWVEDHKELFPTFFAFNDNLKNYFNVFAVTGMHEGLINIGYEGGINNPDGKAFAHKTMQYITDIVNDFIVRDKVACGIEYAPGENASIKLARHDRKWAKEHGREIFTQGKGEDVFLTSGCMLPFSDDNFIDQIENSAEFQGYATSGSILHHFIEDVVPPKELAKYLRNLFKKPINYITFTPTITNCMDCGQHLIGDAKDIEECPTCGSKDIATFSRVIGYVKMISRKNIGVKDGMYVGDYNFWSKARRIDWTERRKFKLNDAQTKF